MRRRTNQGRSRKVGTTFLVLRIASDAGREGSQLGLCLAHAFGQDDAHAVEAGGLSGIWAGYAPQSNVTVRWREHHHVMGLYAGKFFEDGARGVSQAGAALPQLEALPQHEGKETDEDVRSHAILALMPDRPHVELIFLDAESSFGLGEL